MVLPLCTSNHSQQIWEPTQYPLHMPSNCLDFWKILGKPNAILISPSGRHRCIAPYVAPLLSSRKVTMTFLPSYSWQEYVYLHDSIKWEEYSKFSICALGISKLLQMLLVLLASQIRVNYMTVSVEGSCCLFGHFCLYSICFGFLCAIVFSCTSSFSFSVAIIIPHKLQSTIESYIFHGLGFCSIMDPALQTNVTCDYCWKKEAQLAVAWMSKHIEWGHFSSTGWGERKICK